MKKYFIKLIKSLIEITYKVKGNILIIRFLRKPFNTWILPLFYDEKKFKKDAQKWSSQKFYKTEQYSEIEGDVQKKYLKTILNTVNADESILDICCNQGRHLKYLHNKGYRNLEGFDIMNVAIEHLKNSNEYLSGGIYAETNLAQNFIKNTSNLKYDYSITLGATIELMHPGFKIFEELRRILKKGFIFAIQENGHSYPRFYRYQIESNGFAIMQCEEFKDVTILNCKKL
jgi:SAM-dependent methyltransferase